MSHDIVRAAQEKLQAVQERIPNLERQLQAAHAERNDLMAFLRTYEKLSAAATVSSSPPQIRHMAPAPRGQLLFTSASETVRTAKLARDIIEKTGRPVRLGDLYEQVVAKGFAFGGQNPVNTFAARLSNAREKARIISLPNVGWWLSERPWPAAGYAGDTGPEAKASDPAR